MGAVELALSGWDASQLLSALLLCALSLMLGLLLPRPKWVQRGLNARALLLATPFGRWLRAFVLAVHGALIVKAVWREFFAVGTARGVAKALWLTLTTGQAFAWPGRQAGDAEEVAAAVPQDWFVTDDDLAHFRWIIEDDGRPEGVRDWEPMMTKEWPGATYTAWRRSLRSGKTEYKSVTVAEDATAEEFMDFYLDDDTRPKWDGMISEHQLLAAGDLAGRQQVVRWVRTFPFSFVSQREYVIARRVWRGQDGALYAVTKGVAHPSAPLDGRMVRMESYYSCWRSRTVPCPHGSGRPACETTLLHFEDFKIPERLARFAVRHGMAGFVKSMVPWMSRFVQERRLRCAPQDEDAASYGRRAPLRALPATDDDAAPTPFVRAGSLAGSSGGSSSASDASPADSAYAGSEDGGSEGGAARVKRSASMRRLGLAMVASGVAYAIARTASGSALGADVPTGASSAGGGSKAASGDSGHHHKRRHGGGKHRQRSQRPPRPPVPVDA